MFFKGKVLCVITGSSSGFGQAIAKTLTLENGLLHNAKPGSKFVLISRSMSGLEETRALMIKHGYGMERFTKDLLSIDLSDIDSAEKKIKDYMKTLPDDFEDVIIFNNAGSVGDISKTVIQYDSNIVDFQKYFDLNMTSSIFMISFFCKHLVSSHKTIIQTSTLCAIQPFTHMSLYCAAKAGMDMFMRCLAKEHPEIKTLNYAPGPLDTKMGLEMKELHGSMDIRKAFTEMFENGTIVKTEDSAFKLINLLTKMDFESGSHIDYYDIE